MIAYSVRRSDRRSISMEITQEGNVLVRAPRRMTDRQIEAFVQRHRDWLLERLPSMQEKAAFAARLTPAAQAELIRRAEEEFPQRVKKWEAIMDLHPTGVHITGAQKRFGSCSGKNSLCFAWRLMLYPPEAREYVVVHELAHIREKNHGPQFYRLVAAYLPDYKAREALLRGQPRLPW